jgi:hypothetical protein
MLSAHSASVMPNAAVRRSRRKGERTTTLDSLE